MNEAFDQTPSLPGVPLVESPFFETEINRVSLTNDQRRIAFDLHEKGYAVLKFPDDDIDARADRLIDVLSKEFDIPGWREKGWKTREGLRAQDAWKRLDDVRIIAANEKISELLSILYGRQVFPFQTLNFPVGTQQRPHADIVHFSSVPERFMVGVWVALEDIGPDQGPLVYYPGSHRWPMITNDMVENRFARDPQTASLNRYKEYISYWDAMVRTHNIEPEYFHAKKGEALIWSSNLLHGGTAQNDPLKTRWSQVTHYYFEGCTYYIPLLSDHTVGRIRLKTPVDVATGQAVGHKYLGEALKDIDPRG